MAHTLPPGVSIHIESTVSLNLETCMTSHQPIPLERIADRLRPSSPRISPDGLAVAFTVSWASAKEKRPTSQIWLARDGEKPFPFTGGLAGASEPEWSPDGKRLAFLSTRDDEDKKTGIFLIPANGGEAQQLGEVRGDISTLRWSPDGSCIAFIMVDPNTDEEKKRKEEEKRDHIIFEEDLKHKRLWIIDPDTGERRCLTTGPRSVQSYGWAPDSRELVVVTTPLPTVNSRFGPSRVARVPVHGGLEREVTTFPMAPSTPVVGEIDGDRIIAVIGNDHRADPSPSIWVMPWEGGSRRNLLPDLRGAVEDLEADPAARDHVLAVIVEGTHGRLYSVSLATGKRELLSPGALAERGSIESGISADRTGAQITFVWSASDKPENVWKITREDSASRLTSFNDDLEDQLSKGETVRWHSFDGVEIEGTLIRPLGVDHGTPVPLFVQIHGGPAWQWEDRLNLSWHDWAQMLASRGWAVLMPNPRGSTGYGSAFEKLLQDDVGGGESRDLIAGAEAMVDRGIADPERLAIGGWSWGGYLTARTITQTTRFKAAVMGAGVANLISDHGAGDIPDYNPLIHPGHPYDERTWDAYAVGTPVRQASKASTPTLILHGDSDDRVHPTQGQEFYHALKRCGVPVRFVRYPREGHRIMERAHQLDLMERILDWLEQWVPGRA